GFKLWPGIAKTIQQLPVNQLMGEIDERRVVIGVARASRSLPDADDRSRGDLFHRKAPLPGDEQHRIDDVAMAGPAAHEPAVTVARAFTADLFHPPDRLQNLPRILVGQRRFPEIAMITKPGEGRFEGKNDRGTEEKRA